MARVLQFVYGATTVDIEGSSDYRLRVEAWTPQIAQRRTSMLGGRSPYTEVRERLPLQIRVSSVANAHTAINALIDVMDAAAKFWQFNQGNYVTFKFRSDDSATADYEAMVTRPDEGGGVILADDWLQMMEQPNSDIWIDLDLVFWRRGLWYRSDSSITVSSTNVRAIESSSQTTQNLVTPFDCTFQLVSGSIPNAGVGYLFISSIDDTFYLYDSNDFDATTSGSLVTYATGTYNDGANDKVLQVSGSSQDGWQGYVDVSYTQKTGLYKSYVKFRNNNPGTNDLYVSVTFLVGTTNLYETNAILSSDDTAVLEFDTVALPDAPTRVYIEVNSPGAVSSGSFYIDSFVIMQVAEGNNVIKLYGFDSSSGSSEIYIKSHERDGLGSTLYPDTTDSSNSFYYRGDSYLLNGGETPVLTCIYGSGGTEFNPGASSTFNANITRYQMYLIPQ